MTKKTAITAVFSILYCSKFLNLCALLIEDASALVVVKKDAFGLKFKEKLGHTIPELVAGMVLGVICAVIVYHLPF